MQTPFIEKYINPFTDFSFKNSLDKAYDEAFDKGAYAEKQRIAKQLKAINTDILMIAQLTGLSVDEVEKL